MNFNVFISSKKVFCHLTCISTTSVFSMRSYRVGLTLLLILPALEIVYAQTDTLISYNLETKRTHNYDPISFDSTKMFDYSDWNYGTESGLDLLALSAPEYTFHNSGFTDFIPAHNLYSVNNYPARTAVKIFFVTNDSLQQKCSGILVAKNYVLTDCHCIGSFDSNNVFQFQDSISISPAFDNARENTVYGKSAGIEYITFKSNMNNFWRKDIALIKLKEEIGIKTGWVGIAFSKNDDYYKNKVFHKFSYPGTVDLTDSTRIFNGDTLYYNYGILGLINTGWLGYNIYGIRGQSGSSLIYTDNKEYYSLGTQVWADSSRHIRITSEIFYSLKSIINNDLSNDEDDSGINIGYYLSEAYPNPFNPSTKISYVMPNAGFVQLKVYDILGREVQTLVNGIQSQGEHEIIFNANGLSSGTYFYIMQSENFFSTKKLMLLK